MKRNFGLRLVLVHTVWWGVVFGLHYLGYEKMMPRFNIAILLATMTFWYWYGMHSGAQQAFDALRD